MTADQVGLTQLYNRFHKRNESVECIEQLRQQLRVLDESVAKVYGWTDLDLGHDFHDVTFLPANDRVRFTISEPVRLEVIRRLGELNRQRFQVEQSNTAQTVKSRSTKNRSKSAATEAQGELNLGVQSKKRRSKE